MITPLMVEQYFAWVTAASYWTQLWGSKHGRCNFYLE